MDISKAVTLPNGDLYVGSVKGHERPDTINAVPPMEDFEKVPDDVAVRAAAASRPPANFELVQDAITNAAGE